MGEKGAQRDHETRRSEPLGDLTERPGRGLAELAALLPPPSEPGDGLVTPRQGGEPSAVQLLAPGPLQLGEPAALEP
jgi:hypothetical protein